MNIKDMYIIILIFLEGYIEDEDHQIEVKKKKKSKKKKKEVDLEIATEGG